MKPNGRQNKVKSSNNAKSRQSQGKPASDRNTVGSPSALSRTTIVNKRPRSPSQEPGVRRRIIIKKKKLGANNNAQTEQNVTELEPGPSGLAQQPKAMGVDPKR